VTALAIIAVVLGFLGFLALLTVAGHLGNIARSLDRLVDLAADRDFLRELRDR
jgi:hypothetical protein